MAVLLKILGSLGGAGSPPARGEHGTEGPFLEVTFDNGAVSEAFAVVPGLAPLPGIPAHAVAAQLVRDPAPLSAALAGLIEEGTAFCVYPEVPKLGIARAVGRIDGLRAVLELYRPPPEERALAARMAESHRLAQELARARLRAEESPVAAIETDASGAPLWHNRAAARLAEGDGGIAALATRVAGRSGPARLAPPDAGEKSWARLSSMPVGEGRTLTFVEDIGDQRRAERALRGMMSTLGDTFATLDVGLAVFGPDGRLVVFNPALSSLTGLDPAALATRPSLRDFLGAMRSHRRIPEQSDFILWRRRLMERLEAPGARPFSEDWTLPSGDMLRVGARPGETGSLALVFHDISAPVALERRFRAEIEMVRGALDALTDGVAVFGSGGEALFANGAFAGMLGVDPFRSLMPGGIDQLVAELAERLPPAEAWSEFRDFALAAERASEWTAQVRGDDGPLALRAVPLPDRSTMLRVLPEAAARAMPVPKDGWHPEGMRPRTRKAAH